jgi:hypothetical protein
VFTIAYGPVFVAVRIIFLESTFVTVVTLPASLHRQTQNCEFMDLNIVIVGVTYYRKEGQGYSAYSSFRGILLGSQPRGHSSMEKSNRK